MNTQKNRVCPVARAGGLDSRFRRWLQNPRKILAPYIKEGMSVLDIGCGPGFFSMELARMVGDSGRVIAADLQEGMLQRVEKKIRGTALEKRIVLHTCGKDRLGVPETVDFILAFYMVHEVPDQEAFLREAISTLKPEGQLLIVEPPFHTSKAAFAETIRQAQGAGFQVAHRPGMFPNKAVLLRKA